jgi:Asp-tRNA(Asn)/Glu-tRNA(Gln) amidotransferase C subunit
MVQSLIEQLQIGATDGTTPIADLVRKAKLAASKLKVTEFARWTDLELRRYADEEPPLTYRKVYGKVKFWRPGRGWLPILGMNDVDQARAVVLSGGNEGRSKSFNHQQLPWSSSSVAQGTNTIGTISQASCSATPQELAKAVALLLDALPVSDKLSAETTDAVSDLAKAGSELREGRVSFRRVSKALDALSKTEDTAMRVPEVISDLNRTGFAGGSNP